MSKEQLHIDIPNGMKPKQTVTESGIQIEWVSKEKTFAEYAKEYGELFLQDLGVYLNGDSVLIWRHEFKFGLLKFIADDLNGEKFDWKNREQGKHELYFNTPTGQVRSTEISTNKYTSVFFTRAAAEKAIGIIPPEFIESF